MMPHDGCCAASASESYCASYGLTHYLKGALTGGTCCLVTQGTLYGFPVLIPDPPFLWYYRGLVATYTAIRAWEARVIPGTYEYEARAYRARVSRRSSNPIEHTQRRRLLSAGCEATDLALRDWRKPLTRLSGTAASFFVQGAPASSPLHPISVTGGGGG
eukprot:COSAG01_NODE_21946_length_878_cov_1.137356_1_plen_159_part_01